jgi:hypothetical protein
MVSAAMLMETRRRFGFSNRATLNVALLDALRASMPLCETCREIDKAIDAIPEGGEFVESGSFPGKTVQKLDAHFKAHWKDGYELRDLSGRKDPC